MKASPWDNGSKEPCPRTQPSGHGRIRTEDRFRGVAIGGSGGSDEPPRAGKGPQKTLFFFFFFFF